MVEEDILCGMALSALRLSLLWFAVAALTILNIQAAVLAPDAQSADIQESERKQWQFLQTQNNTHKPI